MCLQLSQLYRRISSKTTREAIVRHAWAISVRSGRAVKDKGMESKKGSTNQNAAIANSPRHQHTASPYQPDLASRAKGSSIDVLPAPVGLGLNLGSGGDRKSRNVSEAAERATCASRQLRKKRHCSFHHASRDIA